MGVVFKGCAVKIKIILGAILINKIFDLFWYFIGYIIFLEWLGAVAGTRGVHVCVPGGSATQFVVS